MSDKAMCQPTPAERLRIYLSDERHIYTGTRAARRAMAIEDVEALEDAARRLSQLVDPSPLPPTERETLLAKIAFLEEGLTTACDELRTTQAENEQLNTIAASAIGALHRWESWAIRLQNSVSVPSPLDSSQEVAKRYCARREGER